MHNCSNEPKYASKMILTSHGLGTYDGFILRLRVLQLWPQAASIAQHCLWRCQRHHVWHWRQLHDSRTGSALWRPSKFHWRVRRSTVPCERISQWGAQNGLNACSCPGLYTDLVPALRRKMLARRQCAIEALCNFIREQIAEFRGVLMAGLSRPCWRRRLESSCPKPWATWGLHGAW